MNKFDEKKKKKNCKHVWNILTIRKTKILYSNNIFISGVCPSGSFACDKGKTCVLQRQYCDGKDHCRDRQDENRTECGHFHGSKEMLNKLWIKSHSKTQPVKPACGLL